ncbi:HNH endonuclease [Microbacterium maritypicum]|uniref:HNH endonuclease n=1 Tax=Microbacterium maritypicum TaxID=33918 RepID=UPI000591592C
MSKQSSRGPAWEALRQAVLERDGYTCAYCGREATTADHVTPKAQGGRDELSNLVAACLPCNSKKQDRVLIRNAGFNPRWLDSLW